MARASQQSDVSLTKVAREAGVSLGTVSRVMSGHKSVNAELRRRVLMAGRRLGYVPKHRRLCLGVVTGRYSPALPVGYVSVMTALLSQMAAARGAMVELIDVEELEAVYERHVDAVIGVVFDERIARLREVPNLPIVTINQPMVEHRVHSIYTDHFGQGVAAAEHLVQYGHERIGLLSIERGVWGTDERVRGYQHVLERSGIAIDPTLVRYTSEQAVYDILRRWRRQGVTAILNFSEDTALEALHILTNVLQLRIGQDISTITLEDLPIYQYVTPPQTAIRQPLEAMAEYAVDRCVQLTCGDPRRMDEPAGDGSEKAARAGGAAVSDAASEAAAPEVTDKCFHGELIERDSVADLRAVGAAGGGAGAAQPATTRL